MSEACFTVCSKPALLGRQLNHFVAFCSFLLCDRKITDAECAKKNYKHNISINASEALWLIFLRFVFVTNIGKKKLFLKSE